MNQTEKKNLLLVTAGFPYGESERSFLSEEFEHLCRSFHVSVLAMHTQEQLLYPLEENIVCQRFTYAPLRSAGTLLRLPHLLNTPFFDELRDIRKRYERKKALRLSAYAAAYYLNALQAMDKLRHIIRQQNIQLIYTYWCSEVTLAALLLRQEFPALQVVTRFHGIDLYHHRAISGRQPFRNYIAQHIDRLIFPCHRAKDYFLRTWGQQYAQKSVTAYLGCRPFPPIGRADIPPLVVVSCSNLIPLKRVERIIEALTLLPPGLQVVWHHIGEGELRGALEAQAQALLAPCSNVDYRFHGALPNHQLPALYQTLSPHLFITASSTEGGVPVSIQEAASAGIPTVGTDVGGIGEIVLDGKTGFLLDANASAQALGDAIYTFAEMPPAKQQALGEAAHLLWADTFDATKNADALCRMLMEL